MEIIPEGRNFRLLHDDELYDVLEVLEQYIPEALKVSLINEIFIFISKNYSKLQELVQHLRNAYLFAKQQPEPRMGRLSVMSLEISKPLIKS